MIEAAIETPTFDLTVFKLHFGRLTGKAYTKGERVLRFEAIAHNTAELRCGRMIEKFPEIVTRLAGIAERFATALDCVDTGFLGDGILDQLPTGSGWAPPASAVSTSTNPACATRCAPPWRWPRRPTGSPSPSSPPRSTPSPAPSDADYTIRQAAYDLRKLRGKQLVDKPGTGAPLPGRRTRRTHHRRAAHPARSGHRPDPGRGAQPPDGTQTRALDPRRPRLRTNPHRYANALQRSRHRNTASRLRIRHKPAIPHHQQIVGSRSSSG